MTPQEVPGDRATLTSGDVGTDNYITGRRVSQEPPDDHQFVAGASLHGRPGTLSNPAGEFLELPPDAVPVWRTAQDVSRLSIESFEAQHLQRLIEAWERKARAANLDAETLALCLEQLCDAIESDGPWAFSVHDLIADAREVLDDRRREGA